MPLTLYVSALIDLFLAFPSKGTSSMSHILADDASSRVLSKFLVCTTSEALDLYNVPCGRFVFLKLTYRTSSTSIF